MITLLDFFFWFHSSYTHGEGGIFDGCMYKIMVNETRVLFH